VSDYLFADGAAYGALTEAFLAGLGRIGCALAKAADGVAFFQLRPARLGTRGMDGVKRKLTAFLMAWGSYCAIPCPERAGRRRRGPGWSCTCRSFGLVIGALWALALWAMGALSFPAHFCAPRWRRRCRFCSRAFSI
jgi:hypothetical protein